MACVVAVKLRNRITDVLRVLIRLDVHLGYNYHAFRVFERYTRAEPVSLRSLYVDENRYTPFDRTRYA